VGILKLTTDDGKLKAKRQWIVLTSKAMTFGSPEKKESYSGRISISKIESCQEGPDSDSFTVVSLVEDKKGKETKLHIVFTAEQTKDKERFWAKLSSFITPTSLLTGVAVSTGGSTKSGKGTMKIGGNKKRPLSGIFKSESSIPEEGSLSPGVRPAAPPPLMPPTTAASTKSAEEKPTEAKQTDSESSSLAGSTMTKSQSTGDVLHEKTLSQIESLSQIVQEVRSRGKKDKSNRQSLPVPRPAAPTPDQPVIKELHLKDYLYLWEFGQMDGTNWVPYDETAQKTIELAFRKEQEEVILNHGFFAKDTYTVILKGLGTIPMVQRNNVTKNTRLVRRFPPNYPYPEFAWFYDGRTKQDTDTQWTKYDRVNQIYIERAFCLGEKTLVLKHGFFENNPYEIKFAQKGSHQKSLKTKKKRAIKREPAMNSPSSLQEKKVVLGRKPPEANALERTRTGEVTKKQTKTRTSHTIRHKKSPVAAPTDLPLPAQIKRQTYFRIASPPDLLRRWSEFLKVEAAEAPDPLHLSFGDFLLTFVPEFYLTKIEGYPEPMVALNNDPGWHVGEDVRPEKIIDVQYPEELCSSKQGDQTYILAHTLVQCVVVRWVAEAENWMMLVAAGDTAGKNGLTIMMAELLEKVFPYKRVSKQDVAKIKFDNHNLRSDQRALLTELMSVIADLIKHFETQFNQFPLTSSFEDVCELGNDRKWKTIENLIHGRFCSTLGKIFADGYNQGFWFWEKYYPWDFIKTALTTKEGFYADTAFSTLELEVSTIVAKLDLNPSIPDPTQKLWALFCEGLMNRNLSAWVEIFSMNKGEVERCYLEGSILRSTAVQDIISGLNLLSGLPFSLSYIPVTQEERR